MPEEDYYSTLRRELENPTRAAWAAKAWAPLAEAFLQEHLAGVQRGALALEE